MSGTWNTIDGVEVEITVDDGCNIEDFIEDDCDFLVNIFSKPSTATLAKIREWVESEIGNDKSYRIDTYNYDTDEAESEEDAAGRIKAAVMSGRTIEFDDDPDPFSAHAGIAKLTRDQRELLAQVANSEDTTGGPYLDADSVKYLTYHAIALTKHAAFKTIREARDQQREPKAFAQVEAIFEQLDAA